jgi:hypothetical protein
LDIAYECGWRACVTGISQQSESSIVTDWGFLCWWSCKKLIVVHGF